MINLLLVDDDANWLHALKLYLAADRNFFVMGTAMKHKEALDFIKFHGHEIDIVLMDLHLSSTKWDGIAVATEIKPYCDAKIIMLTSFEEEEAVLQSFAVGAVNFIPKFHYQWLPEAIRTAYYMEGPIQILVKEYARLKQEEQLMELTPAERVIFELIEEGLTQQQIQTKLYKSEKTVKNQVSAILKKLGVKSSKEAIRKVRQGGWLQS
ncbi:response regulator transcription factor [Paenibacillus sedimenti]|uniref:Response regulator transcription factor n=1 Tax=Paenibacillus sedimenti TaxID=2770274 RepID=A0A926KL10_9BACL|nr:response regulator transcription factor [Paenibacillus sedimenti]MBD0379605.1 response regulator transcription factor [Paenibacillus sedimenti]